MSHKLTVVQDNTFGCSGSACKTRRKQHRGDTLKKGQRIVDNSSSWQTMFGQLDNVDAMTNCLIYANALPTRLLLWSLKLATPSASVWALMM